MLLSDGLSKDEQHDLATIVVDQALVNYETYLLQMLFKQWANGKYSTLTEIVREKVLKNEKNSDYLIVEVGQYKPIESIFTVKEIMVPGRSLIVVIACSDPVFGFSEKTLFDNKEHLEHFLEYLLSCDLNPKAKKSISGRLVRIQGLRKK